MARRLRLAAAVLGTAGLGGCITAPPIDNPVLVHTVAENPILVSPGAPTGQSYKEVFEQCVNVIDDYFTIYDANLAAGKIICQPRIAPGYEQIWRPGNPNPRNRLLATLQTIRQTAVIDIHTGERGGYAVAVTVMMEEEDLPRPSRVQTGAVFQEAPTVDRHLEVVGPAPVAPSGTSWYPIGRDFAFEQYLLQRIRRCQ